MPAVSDAQRRFMAMAEHVPGFAKAHGIKMTHQQLHDFASTKEAGLPEHVPHPAESLRMRKRGKHEPPTK